jgi:hypothetical protein
MSVKGRPRARQTTAEGVIAESYLNFSTYSALQVIAWLVGTKDVKGTSLETAESGRNLHLRIQSKPVIRLAEYEVVEISF